MRTWKKINPNPISIHALLAESDTHPITIFVRVVEFLSTLSLRRATRWSRTFWHPKSYFYPRSPCGERRQAAGVAAV